MSKQQTKTSQVKKTQNEMGFSFDKLLPEKFQTPALLILLLLLIVIFFSPVFFGEKTVASGDLIQVKSLREYATKDRDGFSLWNPHIFGGMPAVITAVSPRWFDLTSTIYSVVSLSFYAISNDYSTTYVLSFIILAFTMFFLMRSLGASRMVSFLTSVAVTFSSGITVLYFIGHITKLKSLAVFPFILMMLFRFQKKITPLEVLLFTIGIHILALSAHVQIVFYFLLTALIYFVFYFTRAFVTKDKFLQKQLFKTLGVSAAAGIIALMMSFDTYSQLYEYKPYSTRGTESAAQASVGAGKSDLYDYNTNWSFSPGEVLTFVVPSYFGFGKSTYSGPLTNNQSVEVNTYFGQMTTVDSAMYMGVVVFALGLFAVFARRKEPLVQFLTIMAILYLLISFGRNFPAVFNLFYYYFPMFDNFRVPSMILHVVQIIFPILAGLGVMKIISLRDSKDAHTEKVLKFTAIGFSVLFVLALVLGGSLSSWFSQRVNDYAVSLGNSQQAQTFNALSDYITNMFSGDLKIALALLSLTFGFGFLFATSKISKDFMITAIAVLIIFDLFRISSRAGSYEKLETVNALFKEPDYISVIKQQNEKEPYRIINLKQDGSMGSLGYNMNFNVYFLQEDLYGYSAAKPRRIQDIMETAGPVNVTLWRMLGVKYVATDRPFGADGFTNIYQAQNSFVFRNDRALPRLYFVDSVSVKQPMDILNNIKNDSFDPRALAFVDSAYAGNDFNNISETDSTAFVKINSYKDEVISAEVNANGNNFLFFGTTYMPGWKAYINGIQTKNYITNHAFQGIVVPKGKHTVEFVYEPDGFLFGKYLSLILNILILTAVFVLVIFRNRKRGEENEG